MREKVNSKFFINCDTPQAVYLLGFLWGDGHISKGIYNGKFNRTISVECIKTDIDSIEHLFDLSGKWASHCRIRKGRKEQRALTTHNKELHKFLCENNYKNKSYSNPIILNIIPDNLKHYWWRGYSDTDGCIYYNEGLKIVQYSITSTFEYDWSFFTFLLDNFNIKYRIQRIKRNTGKHSTVTISSKPSVINFCNFLYSGEKFGLPRKIQKYNEILYKFSSNNICRKFS